MVRVNLFETKFPQDNKEKVKFTNEKDGFNFNNDLTSDFSSFFDLHGGENDKPAAPSEDAGSGGGNNHREGIKIDQEGKGEVTVAVDEESVGYVWSNFLVGTSLHGCKNVKEKGWLTRVIWSLAILAMTAALIYALVTILLRYQSHPFVTAWSFKREATVLAPGMTLCIPSRFHKSKVEAASAAYQMLVYHNDVFGEVFDNPTTRRPNTDMIEEWRQELLNISLDGAQREIGFTTQEIIEYGIVIQEPGAFDISRKAVQLVMGDETCWVIHYFGDEDKKDVSPGQDDDAQQESGSSDRDIDTPDAAGEDDEDVSSSDGRSLENSTPNPQKPTVSSLVDDLALSLLSSDKAHVTTDASNQRFDAASATTETLNSSKAFNQSYISEESESEDVEVDGETVDYDTFFLRLGMEDLIYLMININQYEWMGSGQFGGLHLYLHDQRAMHWTTKPILLKPGTYNEVYFRHVRYKFLPLPFKSFTVSQEHIIGNSHIGRDGVQGTLGCVDTKTPKFESPMISRPREFYTADTCILELANNFSVAKCGCVSSNGNDIESYGIRECSVLEFYSCYFPTVSQEYSRLERLMANSREPGTDANEALRCPQECEISQYKTYTSSGDFPAAMDLLWLAEHYNVPKEFYRDNYIVIAVKPEGPLSETIEHVPEITLIDVIGSIGGYMGLCLGASLLSLTELGQAGIACVCAILRQLAKRVNGRRRDQRG